MLGHSPLFATKDGDPRAFALSRRHYTHRPYTDGRRSDPRNRARRLFVGPGEKLVLLTADCPALIAWRRFRSRAGESGVDCAIFRNEGSRVSSELLIHAERIAWQRWPGERLYTYVDPLAVKSPNPGYCFKVAGWRFCGRTKKRGLHILEKLPTKGGNQPPSVNPVNPVNPV